MGVQLYDLVTTTPLGEFINSEIFTSHPEECLSLYQSYLNDFVSCVYQTTRDDEIKVGMTLATTRLVIYFVLSWFAKHLIQMLKKLLLMMQIC